MSLPQEEPKTDQMRPDEPITTPAPVQSEYVWEPDSEKPVSPTLYIARKYLALFKEPAIFIRENIVERCRGPKYYWYHRKYKKTLPIDECYVDDFACMHEADIEYKRNYMVDRYTLDLLRLRRDNCMYWNQTTKDSKYPVMPACQPVSDTYDREEMNFFTKYGEMTWQHTVVMAYNKQKHRMIVERRRALRKGDEVVEDRPSTEPSS